jgi:N-acetylglutamate synthase-like GNAT family acetyltransferase
MTSLRVATTHDLPGIVALLRQHALPTEDLAEAEVFFLVEAQDATLTGVIGLQRFGTAGLLRSLAVAPARKGQGTGRRLLAQLEEHARGQGVTELVLLTQTAQAFFEASGYALIRRDAAPAAMQQAAEFRTLCPASAVCMAKLL